MYLTQLSERRLKKSFKEWDVIQRHPFEAQFEAGTLNRKDWQ